MNKKNNHHNANRKVKETDKKKNQKGEFEFCKVCRLNHDQGERHKYFPKHKSSLAAFLSRFQSKLNDVRYFVKHPIVLASEHASRNRLWCVFCDTDIDELGCSFACENAINHLGSGEHLKILKKFLWKNGGGMDCVDTFRILEADLTKWKNKCKSLKEESVSASGGSHALPFVSANDIHNDLNFGNINNSDQNTFDPFKSNFSNGVMPLQYNTNEYQISHSKLLEVTNAGPVRQHFTSHMPVETLRAASANALGGMEDVFHVSFIMNFVRFIPWQIFRWRNNYHVSFWYILCTCFAVNQNAQLYPTFNAIGFSGNNDSSCVAINQVYQDQRVMKEVSSSQSQGLPNVSQMSCMAPEGLGGNVHTGAPPPWLETSGENELNVKRSASSSSISLSSKSGKSHKLNPKRVGAAWAEKRKLELEMEKRGEILRSDFDDDWLPNFGRVWQSGSRKESRKEFEMEKQKTQKVEVHSEPAIEIQPYISKRMRKEQVSGSSGDCHGTNDDFGDNHT
ncbi:TITAN-like protein isoform X2 [Tripterygium wilfordii]|uniref:TITAN-like protein isoform X2 n=1 Tax=Tripterygium wilfordii TaxID=458696 RepID=UPI0018F80A64|nr:TITAN-like protein isoform X2 [Tripterygium wilfordii]